MATIVAPFTPSAVPAVAPAPEVVAGQKAERVKRPKRLAELGLIALALLAGLGAYAIVGVTMSGALPADFLSHALWLSFLAITMHVVVRLLAPWADQVILPCVIFLNGIGGAMIYRLGLANVGGANAGRNVMWTAISMAAATVVLAMVRDHRLLRRFTYISMIAGLVLLALPVVPGLGVTINGARRWIRVGSFSMQPSEFAKVAFAIFFAGYFRVNQDNLALAGPRIWRLQLPRIRDLGPLALVLVASIGLGTVLQTDLGMSMLLFGLFVVMLYIATQRLSWLAIGGGMFAVAAVIAIGAFPHVLRRMEVWLDPMNPVLYDRVGGSFQLVQGMFGMANGGLIGAGWGRGFPNLIPLSFSDFIFPALGEELGLTGMLAILVVFMIIVERGLRAALTVRDVFGKLLACGLSFIFALQLFAIVGGVTRLLPLTGLTVPFMAQGGSSMMANWILIALLLRISDAARRPSTNPGLGEVATRQNGLPVTTHGEVIVPGHHADAPVIVDPIPVTDGPPTEYLRPVPAAAAAAAVAGDGAFPAVPR